MAVTKIRQKQIESISAENVNSAIEEGAISASRLVAGAGDDGITDQELSYLKGVGKSVQTQLDDRLGKEVLKNELQMTNWDDDNVAATAKAIATMVAKKIGEALISGSMVYNGAWSKLEKDDGTIDTSKVKAGATFCYDKGAQPYGHIVEAGDMIIAAVDYPSMTKTAEWNVVQTNINGAVTSVATSSADGMLVVFSGDKGRIVNTTTLNGLVKLENGVVRIATEDDVPAGTTEVRVNGSKICSFSEVLDLATDGLVSIYPDETKGSIVVSVRYALANGEVKDGECVNGMKVNDDGKLEVSYTKLPQLRTGMKFKDEVDGTRTDFTFPDTYEQNSETVILNGQVLTRDDDYTINASKQVCFSTGNAPKVGDVLRVSYVKK